MTDAPVPDPTEPGPAVERTTVVAVDDLHAHDVRRALVTLSAQRGPTLAPLVRSAAVPGGVALTQLVPSGSVSLASLRAAGPLRAGHVLAVGVAVLEALVVLHDARLAHGGVGMDAVLVAPDGRVVLASTGSAWHRAPGEVDGPSPAGDVESVGELVRDLLGPGSAPAPLVVAVVRALDPDLALRPDAAALLDALRRCGRPDSLVDALWAPPRDTALDSAGFDSSAGDGTGDDDTGHVDEADDDAVEEVPWNPAVPRPGALRPTPTAARSPRRRPASASVRGAPRARPAGRRTSSSHPRLFAAVLVAVLALGALVAAARSATDVAPAITAVAVQQPASSEPSASSSASSVPVPPASSGVDWRGVLTAADRGRTAALAVGSAAQLREWVTGTAYAADLVLARTVAAAGARIEGGQLVLDDVEVVSEEAATAVLRVRDRRTAYAVVVDGSRQEVPERAARTWTVTLVRGGAPVRWRIAEVADAALSPGGRR